MQQLIYLNSFCQWHRVGLAFPREKLLIICAVPSLAAGSVSTYLNSQASLPCIVGPNKVAGVVGCQDVAVCSANAATAALCVSAVCHNAMLHESSSKVHEL